MGFWAELGFSDLAGGFCTRCCRGVYRPVGSSQRIVIPVGFWAGLGFSDLAGGFCTRCCRGVFRPVGSSQRIVIPVGFWAELGFSDLAGLGRVGCPPRLRIFGVFAGQNRLSPTPCWVGGRGAGGDPACSQSEKSPRPTTRLPRVERPEHEQLRFAELDANTATHRPCIPRTERQRHAPTPHSRNRTPPPRPSLRPRNRPPTPPPYLRANQSLQARCPRLACPPRLRIFGVFAGQNRLSPTPCWVGGRGAGGDPARSSSENRRLPPGLFGRAGGGWGPRVFANRKSATFTRPVWEGRGRVGTPRDRQAKIGDVHQA